MSEKIVLSFTRISIKFGDMNWNPLIEILTVSSSNLLSEVIIKKIILYWFGSGLYSTVVETTFKFLTLYKEPSLNMCINFVPKFFLIVACIRFSYEKKCYIKCKTIGKKIRENNERMNFLYNIFINKNHIHSNQFSILGINRISHPINPNPYHPTIFIIVQLMKKRVLYEAHNTKNSNKSNNQNTKIFLKRMLVK